eukprot:CAMPEP_0119108074 /NCGR_PEP_ID=MMETSP1180-20130426/13453_1 /TAXON_ID=3052 ORGANISM="Chlamydomonas cf sp, Strain CCMP681" /NCGR_SAMPLE_ID=MMETSP1180 /ASSEMBLY_ACC=CAM_ASM_000741 /LENGTH=133 /DNA_ID=CAMNT_0007093655 /DNA_START=21 /DNA_END=422 /DNA_ORIENTATION=+
MSRQLPAEQVEHCFNAKRLKNWEVPHTDQKGLQDTGSSRFGTLTSRTGRSSAIVDERGYLLPGVTKINNSFTTKVPVYQKSFARWPQENVSIPFASRSTMGYKGIITDYLPTSTVALKTVDIPGATEFNFSFR